MMMGSNMQTTLDPALRDEVVETLVYITKKLAGHPIAVSNEATQRHLGGRQYHDEFAPLLVDVAKLEYKLRRERSRYFEADLFREPAWNILLDLFIQKHAGRRVSVKSACIASMVAPTTALRWITLLENENLVCRQPSDMDRRTTYLSLTREAHKAMNEYLTAKARHLGWG